MIHVIPIVRYPRVVRVHLMSVSMVVDVSLSMTNSSHGRASFRAMITVKLKCLLCCSIECWWMNVDVRFSSGLRKFFSNVLPHPFICERNTLFALISFSGKMTRERQRKAMGWVITFDGEQVVAMCRRQPYVNSLVKNKIGRDFFVRKRTYEGNEYVRITIVTVSFCCSYWCWLFSKKSIELTIDSSWWYWQPLV